MAVVSTFFSRLLPDRFLIRIILQAGLTKAKKDKLHDPLASEVAAAANKLCRALIRGTAWQEAGSFAGQEGPGNNGGYAMDVLRAALFFVSTSACFTEALARSLSFAGASSRNRLDWWVSSPLLGSGEDSSASLLAVSGGTIRADDDFLNYFLAFPTRIIRVILLAFALVVGANKRVRPRTIRILLAAPIQHKVLTGSAGWNDTLTQLTAKHGNEPID